MTTLYDVLHDLTYGELQNTAIGNLIPDDNESEPDPKSYAQIVSHINQALRKIYSRFFLSAKEIYIQQNESIEIYTLDSKYAQSNLLSTEPIKFIADSLANPFQDDILKIEQVYNEVGELLSLNDFSNDLSIFTPSYRSIQVPWPNDFNTIAVQYRANHPKIVWDISINPQEVEVAVPESLYEPFLLYVAYRAAPVLDGGVEKAGYLQQYETACQTVERLGLHPQAEPGDWRFDAKGWV